MRISKFTTYIINPDAIKKSAIWLDLRIALKDARQRFGTKVSSELTTTKTGSLNIGSVNIEILAPTPELNLGGAGGTDLQGRRLTSNSWVKKANQPNLM